MILRILPPASHFLGEMLRMKADPLRTVLALDERVQQARAALQKTRESDPKFEARIAALMRLVQERDRALSKETWRTLPAVRPHFRIRTPVEARASA
jgi:hypothetical protein